MTKSLVTVFAVFAVLTVVLFANALENPFHYDDKHSIEHNKHLRSLRNIPQFFVDPGTFSSERQGTMFRPLLLSSYAVNYALHENWTVGFRLVNLLIHVLCSTLLFALLVRWTGHRREAWALGLLFLLHPIHGEPINYISSRSDLLVSLFFLLALSLANRPGASCTAYAAALLTKSVAITFPIAAGLWCWLQGRVWGRRRYLAGLILLSGVYLSAIMANRFLTSSLAKAPRSFDQNLWTQLKALVYYVWLYCMPHKLSVEHAFAEANGPADLPVVLAGLLLCSLAALVLLGRRRVESLGFAFFVLLMLPTTLMPLNILVSERRSYLASAGLIGIAVWAWGRLANRQRNWGIVVGGCLCLFYTSFAWQRNPVWASDLSLWEDAVVKGPSMFRARANLGLAYGKEHRYQEAIAELEMALSIKADYADAWVEMGNLYHELDRLEDAEQAYRRALQINPSIEGVYFNLGNIALHRGDVQKAIKLFGETLTRNPEFSKAYNNLGQAYERIGKFDAAQQQYQRAVESDPAFGGAWFNLAAVDERLGQAQDALDAFRRAHEILVKTPEHQVFAYRAREAISRLETALHQ